MNTKVHCRIYNRQTLVPILIVHTGHSISLISVLILSSKFRDEVTGEWRKLHNEELSEIYFLPNIVRVVKSRRMRWAGHVARIVEGRGIGNLRERDQWGNPDVDRRIILRWIFRKWEGVVGTGWSWFRIGDRWQALVSTVRNFRFPKLREIS